MNGVVPRDRPAFPGWSNTHSDARATGTPAQLHGMLLRPAVQVGEEARARSSALIAASVAGLVLSGHGSLLAISFS